MVWVNSERAAFQKVAKVLERKVNGQYFSIECGIVPLGTG